MSDGIECDNPSCDNLADYEVTVHYPQGDVDGHLCEEHSDDDVVTRNRSVNSENEQEDSTDE